MDTLEAIDARRAVRDYLDTCVPEHTVHDLIEAAVQAPSAVNAQPWSFVVIQDKALLRRLSDIAKVKADALPGPEREMLQDPNFNIFYNAGTLLLICAKPLGKHPDWDCCLAGQNLMLAARAKGLGTCVIGFAWPVFGLPEIKKELHIPAHSKVVLPIILGYPRSFPPSHGRKPPEILCWKAPATICV